MKPCWPARVPSILFVSLLAACGGGGSSTGTVAAGGSQALANASPTTSAACTGDAMAIRIGLDALLVKLQRTQRKALPKAIQAFFSSSLSPLGRGPG